jgi:hypothetical protein
MDGASHGRQPRREAGDVLGVAQEQVAARGELPGEAGHQPPLRLAVEIDHDVAAEDDVEPLAERPRLPDQVHLRETDQRAGLRPHGHEARVLARAAEEVLAPQGHRDGLGAPLLVDAARGVGQDLGVHVGRHDLHVPLGQRREVLQQADGQGVRLLAGGAAGAPDAQAARAAAAGALDQLREDDLAEEVEVVRLAEELGLVGRDAVDQLLPLGAGRPLLVDVTEVVAVAGEPELPQPPAEAGGDHGALGVGEVDADLLEDERPEGLELRGADGRRPAVGVRRRFDNGRVWSAHGTLFRSA